MKAIFYLLFVLLILYAIGILEQDITQIELSLVSGGLGILFLFAALNINNIKHNKEV